MVEKETKDVADHILDRNLGKDTADKIREHNKEIENFGTKPEAKPSPSPSPSPTK